MKLLFKHTLLINVVLSLLRKNYKFSKFYLTFYFLQTIPKTIEKFIELLLKYNSESLKINYFKIFLIENVHKKIFTRNFPIISLIKI